jgi:NDP-sugar pyrophosphorylase family protein
MKGIIMAGGEGKRIRPVSGDLPKPMIKLLGRPIIDHILTLLKSCGITEICITLRYRPEIIQEHLGTGTEYGVHLCYHTETEPLGTAGGVKACQDFIGDEPVLIISGDAACDFDLTKLIQAHNTASPAVTMALYEHDEPLEYGLVLIDRNQRVAGFIEKPSWEKVVTNLVNTGIYVLSPEALALVPEGQPFDFAKDLFPLLLERGLPIQGIPMSGYWCDIGTPQSYYRCNMDAINGKLHLTDPWGKEKPVCRSNSNTASSPRRALRHEKIIPCASRARVMRCLSETLMEVGADFMDGITLPDRDGKIRISPATDQSAIIVEADYDEGAGGYFLGPACEQLIHTLEE